MLIYSDSCGDLVQIMIGIHVFSVIRVMSVYIGLIKYMCIS